MNSTMHVMFDVRLNYSESCLFGFANVTKDTQIQQIELIHKCVVSNNL